MSSMDTFRTIKDKQDSLVLAATNLAVILAPYGTDLGPIVDDATGELKELPKGAFSLGEIQKKAGAELSPDMKTEGIMGYGSRAQRRVFVTEENFEIDLTLQEIREVGYRAWLGLNKEDVTTTATTTRMKKSTSSHVQYWTMALIGIDHYKDKEIFPFWKFNKVAITKKGKMTLAEAEEMGMPLTLSVFEDDGAMFEIGLGGPGWPELAKKAGFEAGEQ